MISERYQMSHIDVFFSQEWQELQQSIQRKERALLETKSKITHPVYSLYFPEVSFAQPSVAVIPFLLPVDFSLAVCCFVGCLLLQGVITSLFLIGHPHNKEYIVA